MDNNKATNASNLFKVGQFNSKFNEILEINLPLADIMQSTGLEAHIRKRHENCLRYLDKISEIIENPDFIGKNQREPNSIELIKVYEDNILIAIKLDESSNSLYIASLYEVKQSRIDSRLHSGRLKRF